MQVKCGERGVNEHLQFNFRGGKAGMCISPVRRLRSFLPLLALGITLCFSLSSNAEMRGPDRKHGERARETVAPSLPVPTLLDSVIVSGRVVTRGSDTGLEGISVQAVSTTGAQASAMTDSTGTYSMTLFPDRYIFEAIPGPAGGGIRQKAVSVVAVTADQEEVPVLEVGVTNRNSAVSAAARLLETFGSLSGVDSGDSITQGDPYTDELQSALEIAAAFPQSPETTSESLYRLFLVMQAFQQLAATAETAGEDAGRTLADLSRVLGNLQVLNSHLQAGLDAFLDQKDEVVVAGAELAASDLTLLNELVFGWCSRLLDAVRIRALDYALGMANPSLEGASGASRSLEAYAAFFAAGRQEPAFGETGTYRSTRLQQAEAVFEAIHGNLTDEDLAGAISRAGSFLPGTTDLLNDHKSIRSAVALATGEAAMAVGSSHVADAESIRSLSSTATSGLNDVANLLVTGVESSSSSLPADPVSAASLLISDVADVLTEEFSITGLNALISTLLGTLPETLQDVRKMAFPGEAPEPSLPAGAGDQGVRATHNAIAEFEQFEQELLEARDYVDEGNIKDLVDHMVFDLLPADHRLEESLRISEAIVQGSAWEITEGESRFVERYTALGDFAIAATAHRMKVHVALISLISQAIATGEESLDAASYVAARAAFGTAVDDARNVLAQFSSALTAGMSDVDASSTHPAAVITSLTVLDEEGRSALIDESPESLQVTATVVNTSDQSVSDLEAELLTGGDRFGVEPAGDRIKTIASLSPGEQVELNWTLTYSGDFSSRFIPVLIGLNEPAGQVQAGRAYAATILARDPEDTDGDAMPNAYEARYGLQESVIDAGGDPDEDQASSFIEMLLGSDPKNPDSDGDGVVDGIEIASGADPVDPVQTPSSITGLVAPAVTTLIPQSAMSGEIGTSIVVEGSGFESGIQASFGGGDVDVMDVLVRNSEELVLTIDVKADAMPGQRNLVLTSPIGIKGVFPSVLNIHEKEVTPSLVVLSWSAPDSVGGRPQNLRAESLAQAATKRAAGTTFVTAPARVFLGKGEIVRPPVRISSALDEFEEVEPNNTSVQAQVLTGISPTFVRASADTADAADIFMIYNPGLENEVRDGVEDLFRITTRKAGLKVELVGEQADMDVFLIEEREGGVLEVWASGNHAGVSVETIEVEDLPIGTYLIGATIYDGYPAGPVPTNYTLTITGELAGSGPIIPNLFHVYRSLLPSPTTTGERITSIDGEQAWYVDAIGEEDTYHYAVSAEFSGTETPPTTGVLAHVAAVNHPPLVWSPQVEVSLLLNGDSFLRDLNNNMPLFLDADGDALLYQTTSSDPFVTQVFVENGVLRIDPTGIGESEITVTATDAKGGWATVSFEANVPSGVSNEIAGSGIPTDFAIHANYPNPFNPQTTIPFDVVQQVHVRLEVYDLVGRRVATLIDGSLGAGIYTATFDASNLPSGIYFSRIEMGDFVAVRKMVLVK